MVVLPALDFWIIIKYKTIQYPKLIFFCVCWCSELHVNLFIFVEFWNPELDYISFLNNFVLKKFGVVWFSQYLQHTRFVITIKSHTLLKFFRITVVSVLWGCIPTEIHSTLCAEDEMLHYDYYWKHSYECLALVLGLLGWRWCTEYGK
jgi:hypothetical protein